MRKSQNRPQLAGQTARDRCYGCFRPRHDCFCGTIPTIDNKTEVLIVQHVRERFHPFNTARIVHKALTNSRLIVDHTPQLAARLALRPRAALLYPGPDAKLISDVSIADRPDQLVVLDGTWHHAKTLLRDLPALGDLPRFRLAPDAPGRYRIRREPTLTSLSTIEAIVAALARFEPETSGWDQLIKSFDAMVERQLAHPKAQYGWRRNVRRGRTVRNIPLDVAHNLHNIVVAYGESTPGVRGAKRTSQSPVYWVAERLATGERFECAIAPERPLTDTFLGHLDLTQADFADALSADTASKAWADFLQLADVVVVYCQGTARLLAQMNPAATACLVLQGVDLGAERRYRTLDELVVGEGLKCAQPRHVGRAGRRLVQVAALVRHLHAIAAAHSEA